MMLRMFDQANRRSLAAALIGGLLLFSPPAVAQEETDAQEPRPGTVVVIARVETATIFPENWDGPYADALVVHAWQAEYVEQGELPADVFYGVQYACRDRFMQAEARVKAGGMYYLTMRPWADVVKESPALATIQTFDDTDSFEDEPWFIESIREVAYNAEKHAVWRARVEQGRDGWVFLSRDLERSFCLDADTGTADSAATRQAIKILEKTQAFHDHLSALGIRFIVAIAPNKSSVYPELLTEELPAGSMQPIALIEREHRARGFTFPLLNLTPALLAAKEKDGQVLYLPIDTHWNRLGALIGFDALNRTLEGWFPGQRLPRLDDFDVSWRDEQLPSDLLDSMGIDKQYLRAWPVPQLVEKQPVNLVLSSPKPGIKVYVNRDAGPIKAYVLADSFVAGYEHLIAAGFRRTHVDMTFRTPEALKKFIERIKPDVVIFLYVERMYYNNPLREAALK